MIAAGAAVTVYERGDRFDPKFWMDGKGIAQIEIVCSTVQGTEITRRSSQAVAYTMRRFISHKLESGFPHWLVLFHSVGYTDD